MKATPISKTQDDLPKGWTQTTLGDVAARVQYGTSAKTGSDSEGVPVIRMGNIADGRLVIDKLKYLPTGHKEFPELLLAKGDVLFNRTNSAELVGKTAVYPGNPSPCSFASYLIRVRLGQAYKPELLAHYINSCFGRAWVASVVSQQVGQANVNGSKLQALRLPVPPLPEQHRIVAEIDKQFTRLDAAVEGLKRVRANLKRYRASVLNAACEGRLVPMEAELAPAEGRDYEPADVLLQRILKERRAKWEAAELGKTEANGKAQKSDKWKAKYTEPVATTTSSRDKLPEGWCWATAEQCTSVITDGEHITPERAAKGVFLLSARNVRDGKLSLDDVDFVPEAVYERIAKRLVIMPDDVLLSCSGSVGRSCVAPPNLKFTLVRSVAVLKPVLEMGHYLSAALRSPILQAQITDKKTQTAQSNIFQGKIKTLMFPLPPLAEQRRIVAEVERRLSVIDELEAVAAANLTRAERLRQSILKRAFEGKLVPQDPNDEPASVLLERIRAERKVIGERAASRERVNRTKKKQP